VLSWPLGYVVLAAGRKRWYLATELSSQAAHAALAIWLVPRYGPVGAAYAFLGCFAIGIPVVAVVAYRLIEYSWSAAVIRMMLLSSTLMGLALAANRILPDVLGVILGGVITLIGGVWSLRGLALRLSVSHRLVRWMQRVPGLRRLAGV